MNIAFIPIDNRPVCYTLPEQICAISDSIKLFMPERDLLGGLVKNADIDEILIWLEGLKDIDTVVICLDTIAYGGLIPSRRSIDSFEDIKLRVERLKRILENKKVYAFSSIMRISNNNVNEEEKEYWNKWGKKIFNYSYCMDKFGTMCKKEVPDEILEDYLSTRKRNFEINKLYLEWQKEGFFETLIFSKDDCAEYGFNVQEALALEKLGGFVKTGADEIPLSLIARAVNNSLQFKEQKLKVAPIFLVPEYKNLISNYEDISIEKSVMGQLELADCKVCEPDEADVLLYVNNFEQHQGEIVMKVDTKSFSGNWQKPDKPYMIADVRFANGADNAFVNKLFEAGFDENFCGYSAWNTSANTLGSLICGAVVMTSPAFLNRFAQRTALSPNFWRADYRQRANGQGVEPCRQTRLMPTTKQGWGEVNFKKLQVIRFLDDWAYQANVRQQLTEPNVEILKEKMKPFEEIVLKLFDVRYNINYKFPWNRLFEVEIELS